MASWRDPPVRRQCATPERRGRAEAGVDSGPRGGNRGMGERLYQRDSYLRRFEARVTAVRGDGVALDRTAFFPTGGGVLGDEGTLTGPGGQTWRVVETVEDAQGIL